MALQQALPQGIVTQPNCNCGQTAPMCCEPCPTECVPCDSGYNGGDCGCQTAPGEFFGGYVEGSVPPQGYENTVIPEGTVIQGSGTYPGPTN